MLVEVSEENLVRHLHTTMTLNKLHLIRFCVSRDVWRLVDLVQLLEDKVVCSVILANDDQSATLLVVADVDLTSGQTG